MVDILLKKKLMVDIYNLEQSALKIFINIFLIKIFLRPN